MLRVALVVTAAWLALLLLRLLLGAQLRGPVADVGQFVLVIGYVVVVPAGCLPALWKPKAPRDRRVAVGLIGLWAAFLVWAATLTL